MDEGDSINKKFVWLMSSSVLFYYGNSFKTYAKA